jgi:membrane fusion protein (multidrug efflux system)
MMARWRRPVLIALGFVALVAAAAVGVRWWRFYQTHVSTDDAYVRADVAQVTPRIPGTIVELAVRENEHVEQGDLIVRLDRAEYELKLHETEAAVAHAIRTTEEMKAAVLTAQSHLAVAEADLAQRRLDHSRAEQLTGRAAMPIERLDQARTSLRAAEARVEAARHEVTGAQAALGSPLDAPSTDAAIVRQAVAARDIAALLLSYTEVRAPIAGVIARRTIELGQRIQPGQPLMMIVPLRRVYIEANFKETQLSSVCVGQPAEIVADYYPDVVYRGHVESLAPGSGAAFALLPPENATGNWVKVVQRVPVRIALDEPPPIDRPLRVSVSVVATIDVSGEPSDHKGAVAEARAPAR